MAAQLHSSMADQTLVLSLDDAAHRNALGPEVYASGIEAMAMASRRSAATALGSATVPPAAVLQCSALPVQWQQCSAALPACCTACRERACANNVLKFIAL